MYIIPTRTKPSGTPLIFPQIVIHKSRLTDWPHSGLMHIPKQKYKRFLYALFPNLRTVELGAVTTVKVYRYVRNKKKKYRMRFPIKLAIASAVAFVFIIGVGFIMFPKVIKGKIKAMVNLKPGSELREMFVKVPFALSFKVYIFSVLNPEDVQNGGMPRLEEIGPFCYEEWKTKINIEDIEADDSMSYDPVDTFYKADGPDCVDDNTEVTIPHPMILAMVNTVTRTKPGATGITGKAIKSIWSNPKSLFVKVKAKDLLFDGIIIPCGVTDFAGKAVCTTLKHEPTMKVIDEDNVAFSLMGPKNATPGKRIKAHRGLRNYRDVGRIMTFDGQPKMSVWNVTKCDQILGTDGTIFPPLIKKEEGLPSFAPDLCRSLVAQYQSKTKYNGIPVNIFSAGLGDQSKNPDEKCYCTTPDTCLKKGLMDLFKCSQVPIYVSLPHFYDSHPSYLKGVKGLNPDVEKHGIKLLFEQMTGSPVSAKKRLQFNMPLEPNPKIELFNNFSPTVLPLFWVEEGVELNKTLTKPLKDLFTIKKIVSVSKILILLMSLTGLVAAGYLEYKSGQSINITTVKDTKVIPVESNGISTVYNEQNGGKINSGYDEKY